MSASLKEKAIKGVSWGFIERFGMQGTSFIFGIIMARLLTPEDFGLIGMITIFFAVAQVFIRSGFVAAYVQKKEVSQTDADTIFYTNLAISIFLYFVLWFAAPYISQFYEESQLTALTRVMGFIIILQAFNIIQQAQIKRQLDFKRKTKITIFAALLSGITGVLAAYYDQGVWSIVVRNLSNVAIIVIGLWITSQWRPKLQFSKKSFRAMFSFGAWLLGANIVKTIFDNIYKVVIGKFFPAAQLGFYTKSKQFQEIGSKQITGAVSSVTLSVFSRFQDDNVQFQKSVRKFLTHTQIIVMPIMVTLIVVAEPFVLLLLTEKWAPMIPFLQLLCVIGILYPFGSINASAIMAKGKSRLNFNISMVQNSLRVINIVIMYRFGVMYIIFGEILVTAISVIIATYYTGKLVNFGLLKQIQNTGKIASGAALAGLSTLGFSLLIDNNWVLLFGGTALSLGLFTGSQYLMNRKLFMEIVALQGTFKK